MKSIICLFLLFVCASSKSEYDPSYTHFYDITFNKRYTVDISQFGTFLPAGHGYYFRVSCFKNDKMQIELRVYRYADISFIVDVCAYNYRPSDYDVYNAREVVSSCLVLTGVKSYETDYDIYKYPFKTGSDHEYLSIYLNNQKSLHYLDVYVYSEKGLAGGIIAVIVIVPTVVVIGIIVAICQKMGCIKKDDHYSSEDINVSPVTNNYI